MVKRLIIYVFLVIAINPVNDSMAMAVSLSPQKTPFLEAYQAIGNGVMKVMFWKVYRAELYAKKKPFQINQFPQALKITYLRDINKDDLVEATKDQWRHIGIKKEKITAWLIALRTIFPNIKEGETITLIVDSSKQSHFYFTNHKKQNQHLGSIQDTDFGVAFLAIWLSEKTSRPALRQQLLGENK